MAKAKPAVDSKAADEKQSAKMRALQTAIDQIEKAYGAGSIMKLGQTTTLNVDVIPTGSLGLDIALGVGGVPKGRIVEIYGPESSGKTTVALQMVAQAQKAGGTAAFIDVEHALDPVYAGALGVDIDGLLVSQPDTGEQALEITEALVRSGAIDIVVIDSVAAMVTKAEIEGEMGESHMGLQARLMSQAMRKLTGIIGKSNCVAIFINQIREKIGVMFGNPETTTGGRALKYFATVRIDVRKGEAIKDGNEIIGNVTKCKVVKNKVAPPFKECTFDLLYGEGTSYEGEIIDIGTALGVIVKSGSWYSYKGERIGQGKEKVRQFLKEHPEVSAEVEQIIRDNMDKLVFAPSKGAKGGNIEIRKGTDVTVDAAPKAPAPSSSDALTDIVLDVEADLEDFE
ncbi:recombinase RecA [Fumia xinanensis]|uniref:Protein RecA n=1 Tax=Fumia xinanensis TaxID=2763659 RepID=A0A926E3G9_9FIRM|nr:recombinase RecA [Fumia xinanensis]MBC8558521.1 recombinase RecA [Fumia xinanensis]